MPGSSTRHSIAHLLFAYSCTARKKRKGEKRRKDAVYPTLEDPYLPHSLGDKPANPQGKGERKKKDRSVPFASSTLRRPHSSLYLSDRLTGEGEGGRKKKKETEPSGARVVCFPLVNDSAVTAADQREGGGGRGKGKKERWTPGSHLITLLVCRVRRFSPRLSSGSVSLCRDWKREKKTVSRLVRSALTQPTTLWSKSA